MRAKIKPRAKPDLRRIRLTKCYTLPEVANILGVGIGTVRAWVRVGLPILEDSRPFLIPGDSLKVWLKMRIASRKQRCLPNEFYCCRCRIPKTSQFGSVVVVPRNRKTVAIQAHCNTCGAKMNKAGSLAHILEINATFGLETVAQVSLAGCENPAVNQHLEKEPIK
jgi:hypothetical protein